VDDVVVVGTKIKFENHDTIYKVLAVFSFASPYRHYLQLDKPLTSDVKYGTKFTIVFYPENSITLTNVECLNFKLKYPDVHIGVTTGRVRLYNQKSMAWITDYTSEGNTALGTNAQYASCLVKNIPMSGSYLSGGGFIYSLKEVLCSDDFWFSFGAYYLKSLGSITQVSATENGTHIPVSASAGVIFGADADSTGYNAKLCLYYIVSNGNGIYRQDISFAAYLNFANSGWTNANRVSRKVEGNYAGFLNTDVLNPSKDDNYYYENATDVKKFLAYVAGAGATNVMTGAGLNTITGVHAQAGESGATTQLIFLADSGLAKIISMATISTYTTEAGGGGTTLTLGGNCTNTSLAIATTISGVFKGYDNIVVFADRPAQKVYFLDRTTAKVWCISDSTLCNYPNMGGLNDFISTWIQEDSINVDFAYLCSKLNWNYYSVPRRIIKGDILGNTLGTTLLKLGDRVTLDSTVVGSSGSGIKAWVSKISYKIDEDLYSFEFLEDTAA
jgi:hypothetical protein